MIGGKGLFLFMAFILYHIYFLYLLVKLICLIEDIHWLLVLRIFKTFCLFFFFLPFNWYMFFLDLYIFCIHQDPLFSICIAIYPIFEEISQSLSKCLSIVNLEAG